MTTETREFKVELTKDHEYFVNTVRTPGFTSIAREMGIIKDNGFYTEEGRSQGQALSQWGLFLAQGNVPTSEPDPRIAGRVAGFRKFMAESNFKFIGGETPLYSDDLKFCGKPDIWGMMHPHSCVIDIKRGSKLPWHPLQTAAYKILLEEDLGFLVQKRYSLYLREGGYSLDEHKDKNDIARWQAIVAGFHAKNHYE